MVMVSIAEKMSGSVRTADNNAALLQAALGITQRII
jgi:hypothetical protein